MKPGKAGCIAVIAGMFAAGGLAAHAKNYTAAEFVQKASVANEFEVKSSQLALEKSNSSEVKSFAQTMVRDHTTTGEKLEDVLKESGSGLKPASELDERHQKLLNKLQSSAGKVFDREYISIQSAAHKEAVSLFDDYSRNGDDPALKEFAAETLPTLKGHLNHVQELKGNH